MSRNRSFLQGQLDCLRQSLMLLESACSDIPLRSRLREEINELSSQVLAPPSQPPRTIEIRQVMDILPQARASLNLLAAAGHLGNHGENGIASGLRSTLDGFDLALGSQVRKSIGAKVRGLYVIIDPEVTGGRDPVEIASGALRGGAKVLQLRDKLREKGQTLLLAIALKELCARYDALLIINDHADLATVVDADGLHIGQGDLPISEARRVLKPKQIIGRSNYTLEEAMESQELGADHIALGNIYPTSSKASIVDRDSIGPDAVRRVKVAVNVPVVAIGGINEENLEPVARAGADAICVTGAVGLAADPEEASRRLVDIVHRAKGNA